jgi:hypothetical protein
MTARDKIDQNMEQFSVRERQWIYLGPIAAAPIAHISVTLYKEARSPQQKKFIMGFGIIGATMATIGMRLYLMGHAGYAGRGNEHVVNRERRVTQREKNEIENPSVGTIVKEAMKGLG